MDASYEDIIRHILSRFDIGQDPPLPNGTPEQGPIPPQRPSALPAEMMGPETPEMPEMPGGNYFREGEYMPRAPSPLAGRSRMESNPDLLELMIQMYTR